MNEAVIGDVRIAAAHDGEAELIVAIVYPNGGVTEIALDHFASTRLMELCAAAEVEELKDKSWEYVREALYWSFNRFNSGRTL